MSIFRIVVVINQRMRPSLATGECQIPDVQDYPILTSSFVPQFTALYTLNHINLVQIGF